MNPSPDQNPLAATIVPTTRRRFHAGWLLAGWLLALAALDTRLPPPVPRPVELDVVMDSSVESTTEVFFDLGKGFQPQDNATAHLARGTAPQTLTFPVPAGLVRAIRLDPLTVPGTVHLHSALLVQADDHQSLRTLDPHGVTPLNQIARLTPQPDGVEIVTTPNSDDSGVMLPFGGPLDVQVPWFDRLVHYVGIDLSVTFVLGLAAGLAYWFGPVLRARVLPRLRPVAEPVRRLDRRFAAWAAVLSRPEIARIDRWVFWFYGACALVFGGLALAGFHGSSLDEYSSQYAWSGVKVAPVYGHAREIRSDEWALHTPAVLNQLYRRQTLQAETSAFGNQDAALLISLPSRDFTEVFRPEFWAFHVLPAPAAFAVYWQCKGFILLTGVFSLLLLLTRGHSGLSALGALWLFFSAHMQWAYSWTSLLPEMTGFFGWTLCLTLYLCVGRNRYLLAAAAAGGVISAVDFALCFYPPHQIPFVLFGVLLVPTWLWTHRAAVLRQDLIARHGLALAGCWGVVLLVLAGFFLETRGGIATAAHTVYPGQRVSNGGGIPLEALASHFLDFWKTPAHFPAAQGNICEGTGFLWLLPVTLILLGRRPGGPGGRETVLAVCWLAAGAIAAWMVLPVPAEVGHWLLFDHVPAVRCLPALGFVNVVGVIVYLSLPKPEAVRADADRQTGFWRGSAALAAFLALLALLGLSNEIYQGFFHPSEIGLGALYAAALAFCLWERRTRLFAGLLLVPLVLAYGLVNPLDRGLRVVTRSQLFKTIQADPHLREGKWLVYSHDFTLTGFVVATGAEVFNSFKVLPDLRAMAPFDPTGRFEHSYNQSGHMLVRPLPAGQPSLFENPDVGLLRWSVSPLDPALRQAGIRYVVFDEVPDPALVAGLHRIAPDVPLVSIYELP